jgi:hypothetical protein
MNKLIDLGNLSVHTIRKNGYRVEVTHRRLYKFLSEGNVITTDPISEYESSLAFSEQERRNGLQQKGGSTSVRIFGSSGKLLWETLVVCSKKDNYSKSLGVEIALNRLAEWTNRKVSYLFTADVRAAGEVVWEGIDGKEYRGQYISDFPDAHDYNKAGCYPMMTFVAPVWRFIKRTEMGACSAYASRTNWY